MKLRMATRKSALALWQTEYVAGELKKRFPELVIELVPLSTKGDEILDKSLTAIGGKGLFIKELEQALLDGRADMAVHSMKDVGDLPDGFTIGAVLPRENPYDAFVSNHFNDFNDLPQNAKVGTCSLRRKMQIQALRPDLQLIDLRGNVQTRLKKLDDGEFDAIILACAGLKRLGLENRIKKELREFIPACGQGIIGVEILENSPFIQYIQELDDLSSRICVTAERYIRSRYNADCQTPFACFSIFHQDTEKLEFWSKYWENGQLDPRDVLHYTVGGLTENGVYSPELLKQGLEWLLSHHY